MATAIAAADYRALAEWRYRIRHFLGEGDAAARKAGLEPQQYLLLLALRGLPRGSEATIRTLAERLALKHNSAVERIDRLEARGFVHRHRSAKDGRCVLVSLLPPGKRLVEMVARQRITELRADGAALVNALDALLGNQRSRKRTRAAPSGEEKSSGRRK